MLSPVVMGSPGRHLFCIISRHGVAVAFAGVYWESVLREKFGVKSGDSQAGFVKHALEALLGMLVMLLQCGCIHPIL